MMSKRGLKAKRITMIGTGHDGDPDAKERRVTTGNGFACVGGSKETHERMQEEGIRMTELAAKKGKTLDQLDAQESLDVMMKAVRHR